MKRLDYGLLFLILFSVGCSKFRPGGAGVNSSDLDKTSVHSSTLAVSSPPADSTVQKSFVLSGQCVKGAGAVMLSGALENPGSSSCAANSRFSYSVIVTSSSGIKLLTVTQGLNSLNVTYTYSDSTTPVMSIPVITSVTALSSSQLKINWSASTINIGSVENYRIIRNDVLLTTISSAQLEYTDGSLNALTPYKYQIQAVSALGALSDKSLAVNGTTLAIVNPKPTAPAILGATVLSSSQIRINWSSSTIASGSVNSYQIFREGILTSTVPSTQTEFTDSALLAATAYSYQLKAVSLAGQLSDFSTVVTATTHNDPGTIVTEAPPGPELIVNPGFENGMVGWGTGSGELLAGVGYRGTSGFRLSPAAGSIGQVVNVVGGNTYRLVAFTKSDVSNGGAALRYYYTLPSGEAFSGLTPITSTWQHSTIEFYIPVGVTRVSVYIWKNAGTQYVYADDFSLRTITPLNPKPVLVAEGDSITVGPYTGFYAGVTSQLSYSNFAVGGSGIVSMTARKQAVIDRKPTSGAWVVTFLIGANDLFSYDPQVYAAKVFSYADELTN